MAQAVHLSGSYNIDMGSAACPEYYEVNKLTLRKFLSQHFRAVNIMPLVLHTHSFISYGRSSILEMNNVINLLAPELFFLF